MIMIIVTLVGLHAGLSFAVHAVASLGTIDLRMGQGGALNSRYAADG